MPSDPKNLHLKLLEIKTSNWQEKNMGFCCTMAFTLE
jgi:hypothetical protein